MNWLRQNFPDVADLALKHLWLSVCAIALSICIAVPLGWIANHAPFLRGPLTTGTGLLYSVPSLPLLIAIPVVLGLPLQSDVTIIVALTVYGVALLVRSATDAFRAISNDVTLSATAIGYSSWSRFWRVDLPLAGPLLLAGIRVVVVSTVSLVTIGAVVGISSLGTLLTDGFQRGITAEIFTGLILTIVVAMLLDGCCLAADRMLFPWHRAPSHLRKRQLS